MSSREQFKRYGRNASSTLQKGMRVIVVGRLNYRSWETQDGQNRSVVDIAIDEIAPSLRCKSKC